MYIDIVPNRKSNPAILLREAWREGSKTRKKTIANISHWPMERVNALRKILKGELFIPNFIPASEAIQIKHSIAHGHVEAILGSIKKIGLDKLISSKNCPEQKLVVAMIAERLLNPCSKAAAIRDWHTTTLARELEIEDANENDLYKAMDWLIDRQSRIEKKLAKRHLCEGDLVYYDVSSSYYEGRTCPLAQFGYSRDKKRGKKIIVYGAMTNSDGVPVAIQVYPGKTGDPSTVPDQARKLRRNFGLNRLVLVGDRGMLTQVQIDHLKKYKGLGWISALKSQKIKKLVASGSIQQSLFDDKNLAEITSSEFPDERLVVCYNPLLADERRHTREALLDLTEKQLEKILNQVRRRTKKPLTAAEIGKKVGTAFNKYKMGKHFEVKIADNSIQYTRKLESIANESELDGIYVLRTSEPETNLSADNVVRGYKTLSKVERVFRTMKSLGLHVRPIRHREERRVKAHIFICMLAYYLEWHMRRSLAALLFDDEELEKERKRRDPVKPAEPSRSAKMKKRTKKNADGFQVHSFQTLIKTLGTRCQNICQVEIDGEDMTFNKLTDLTAFQQKCFELLGLHPVDGN